MRKEHASRLSAGELCRKYGISDLAFQKWRLRYCGWESPSTRKLEALEDENRRLKKLLAVSLMRGHSRKCSKKTSDFSLRTCCEEIDRATEPQRGPQPTALEPQRAHANRVRSTLQKGAETGTTLLMNKGKSGSRHGL